jgi:hypothetical protein
VAVAGKIDTILGVIRRLHLGNLQSGDWVRVGPIGYNRDYIFLPLDVFRCNPAYTEDFDEA